VSEIWWLAIAGFLLGWAITDLARYVYNRDNRGSRESDRTFWDDDDSGGE
jgi:hypothetical protein